MSEKKQRPYKHPQINLRIPEELKEKIQKLADKNNRSMNAEIVHIIESYLDLTTEKMTDTEMEKILRNFLARLDSRLSESDKK